MVSRPQLKELLLQSLEHEYGGVLLYQTALECVLDQDLRAEWEKYLAQTQTHVELLTSACEQLGLDPDEMTPGRKIVQHNGKDRKSTRLNSSHMSISYAVFCLKKKKYASSASNSRPR